MFYPFMSGKSHLINFYAKFLQISKLLHFICVPSVSMECKRNAEEISEIRGQKVVLKKCKRIAGKTSKRRFYFLCLTSTKKHYSFKSNMRVQKSR